MRTLSTSAVIIYLVGLTRASQVPLADMATLQTFRTNRSDAATVSISKAWDVLGPFPQAAREQHFLNPSFPLSLHKDIPIDYSATYPSSLADNATVGWSTARRRDDGVIEVKYPDIRWAALRSTVGWAGLQHHSLLHGVITVSVPHQSPPLDGKNRLRHDLHVSIEQGSFFTLIPRSSPTSPIEWHTGNIYALRPSSPSIIRLSPPNDTSNPDEYVYDMYISADYEIRLFGDPLANRQSSIPLTSVRVQVSVYTSVDRVRIVGDADDGEVVVPDFVDGWAMGEALGVRLTAGREWVEVVDARVADVPGLTVTALLPFLKLAPTQTRALPLRLTQTSPLPTRISTLPLTLSLLSSSGLHTTLTTALPIHHLPHWSTHTSQSPLHITYFLSRSPHTFLAKPPLRPSSSPQPPILALHGAGVPLTSPFWPASIPRFEHSWAVFPLGSSEWGMDWHGVSSEDAWGCVEALRELVGGEKAGGRWGRGWELGGRTVLVGHSNGGQGVWWNALRWPDRVVAALPASAYLTPPTYVPLTHSRSSRFLDPALAAILDAASLEERNDLYLSNIVGIAPGGKSGMQEGKEWVMVLHGGEDENVPVWHGREAGSLAKSWGANVRFIEEPGMPHWWDGTFQSAQAKAFFEHTLAASDAEKEKAVPDKFRLAVAQPEHQGSMFGWSVDEVEVPGRLATLDVRRVPLDGEMTLLEVETVNVEAFTVGRIEGWEKVGGVIVDSVTVDRAVLRRGVTLRRSSDGFTIQTDSSHRGTSVPTGPLTSILRSASAILIIIPHDRPALLSAALRFAHVLLLYLRIDSQIMYDEEALSLWEAGELGEGNVVVLGRAENGFGMRLLEERRTEFGFDEEGAWVLKETVLDKSSTGILFLHPHPSSISALALFISGSDDEGLERALRAFPIRTGVAVPHWIVIGEKADWQGAGGIVGAGFWNKDWKWSETMSWLR